jgi:hypothetical protein
VGEAGGGVKKIASLFNITRIYNAVSSASYMRRGQALARDYAPKRIAFGKPLSEHPLHLETLAELQVECEAAFHLSMYLCELLGKEETGKATEEESRTLRLLTPVAKLFTAKQAVAHSSEILESFGGAGYIEDTGLPRLLRDSQVLSIWEGTTNVLSLDLLRAIAKESAFEGFEAAVRASLSRAWDPSLKPAVAAIQQAMKELQAHLQRMVQSPEIGEIGARPFAMSVGRTACAWQLLEHAGWAIGAKRKDRAIYKVSLDRWLRRPLVQLSQSIPEESDLTRSLALD